MLLVGYVMGIRSERRLCDEVHLNLAHRWFCRLDLTAPVPDHSTFSKNRHGGFRDSDLLRRLFEAVKGDFALTSGRHLRIRRVTNPSLPKSFKHPPCGSDPTPWGKRKLGH